MLLLEKYFSINNVCYVPKIYYFGFNRINGNGCYIFPNGHKIWYKNGMFHREDGPAIICGDKHEEWCINGEYHREDGPAVIYSNGIEVWFKNGKRHREDGPAAIYPDGTKKWYKNGLCYHTLK